MDWIGSDCKKLIHEDLYYITSQLCESHLEEIQPRGFRHGQFPVRGVCSSMGGSGGCFWVEEAAAANPQSLHLCNMYIVTLYIHSAAAEVGRAADVAGRPVAGRGGIFASCDVFPQCLVEL